MNEEKLNLAGQGDRLINFIVDLIAFLIIWFVLSIILVVLGLNQTYIDETGEANLIVPMIILIPTFWGYFIIAEYLSQKTLGKIFTKTQVVTKTGDKPSIGKIIIRTLVRSIPFEYISYLFTVKGIHDLLSSTRVIKINKNAS